MTVHIKASQGNGSLQVSCVALSGEEFLTVEVEVRDEMAHLELRIRCRLDWEMMDFGGSQSSLDHVTSIS